MLQFLGIAGANGTSVALAEESSVGEPVGAPGAAPVGEPEEVMPVIRVFPRGAAVRSVGPSCILCESTANRATRVWDEEVENVQRKLSSYQTLGIVSTLLFGFSATVMFEVTVSPDIPNGNGALAIATVLLATLATSMSMVSTFVFIYHSYHGDSLLSTRMKSNDDPALTPVMLAHQFIDATRGQRYIAQAFQGIASFSLLASLAMVVHLGRGVDSDGTEWLCTAVVASMGLLTVYLVWHSNRARSRVRKEGKARMPHLNASHSML
jgi:hypothetical protein